MLRKRPWKLAVCAAAFVLSAAGCSGGSDDTDVASDSVVIGITEPEHLLPTNTTEVDGSEVLSSLFYPLVSFDDAGRPVEAAAKSVSSRDNTVWTVKLKEGFTFSNGEKVTADNYIDAWNYGAYGPNHQDGAYFFERIDGYADMQARDPDGDGPQKASTPRAKTLSGLKKADDLTFTVTLSAPFTGWRSVLASGVFYPLPKAAFSAPGVIRDGFEDAPIGNGPFTMKGSWKHGSPIAVVRRDDFRGARPRINGVVWKTYPDQALEYADLVAGNVDVQTAIPVEKVSSASGELDGRVRQSPNSSFQFVGFPTYQKDFANPDVRRAISMAINRQEMTDRLFLGSQTPATAFVAPTVNGYRPDACGENCTYNPGRARQLYTAAHGPSSLTITYNADGPHKAWVDAMCLQIRTSLGVDCTGAAEPRIADLLTRVEHREPVGMFRLGWVMDYPLMESYLGPLYTTNGSSNYWGYSNPAFDNLVKEGSEARTNAEATRKWQQAEDILAQDMPVIPLRFGQNVYGYSERVTDVHVDAFQRVDLSRIRLAG
jgi:oligopeptide transport system substrate-binding protein